MSGLRDELAQLLLHADYRTPNASYEDIADAILAHLRTYLTSDVVVAIIDDHVYDDPRTGNALVIREAVLAALDEAVGS